MKVIKLSKYFIPHNYNDTRYKGSVAAYGQLVIINDLGYSIKNMTNEDIFDVNGNLIHEYIYSYQRIVIVDPKVVATIVRFYAPSLAGSS